MNTEIICFATGKTNENLPECEKQLCTLIGQLELDIPERTQCSADEKQLISAFKEAATNNQAVFLCGDIEVSKELICKVYRLKSEESEEYKNLLIRRCAEVNEEVLSFPEGSNVAFCRETADSAFYLKASGKMIFALPSNPVSLKGIIDDCVIPYFAEEKDIHLSRTEIKLFGISEKEVFSVISAIKNKYPVKIHTHSSCGKITLNISSCAKSVKQADTACYGAIAELKNSFGDSIYEVGQRNLAEVTVEMLKRNGMKVSTAESCTGGMLSQAITSVSGASDVLEMGICAYSNRIKRDAIGVSETVLNSFGAVSKETAAALSKGIRQLSGAQLGVGITGIAGPGRSEGKAVGTVYIALSDGKNFWIRPLTLPETADRDDIREYATSAALDLIRRYLICLPAVLPGACAEENLHLLSSQPDINYSGSAPIDPTPVVTEAQPVEIKEEVAPVYISEQSETPVFVPDENEVESPVLVPDEEPTEFADFINDNYGEGNNSDDDSPEIVAENYDDDIGIILDDDYERPFKKEKKKKESSSKSSKGIKIAFTAVIAVLLVAAIVFGNYFFKIYRDLSQIDTARETYTTLSKEEAFSKLAAENSDFTAWINIGDTKVNNPVYQANDNSFYATHNMNKQKSRYGALFFDYRDTVNGDGKSKNLVVYGQNMNDGAMFGTLSNYQDLSFLNSNSEITLTTAENKEVYKVYAVIITNASKEQDDGHFFDFSRPTFDSVTAFDSWAAELKLKNLYITDLQIGYEDSFLTLVTTSKAFDNARLAVIAKKAVSDDSGATYAVNPSPVYPKAWYDERNLEQPSSGVMTGNSTVSDTSSEELSSEESSLEESSSEQSSSSTPSTPNPTPTPSTPSSSQPESSESQTSGTDSSEPDNSENNSTENSNPESGDSQGNEYENTTTE